MKLSELAALLKTLPIPVTYSHFEQPTTPPFIVYVNKSNDNLFADNKVHIEIENVNIEFYSHKKNLAMEKQIQDLLNNNELPYDKSESYIKEEKLIKINYEVSIL